MVYNIGSYALTGGGQGRLLDAGFAYTAGTNNGNEPDPEETLPPPPALMLQSSEWNAKASHYRMASSSGTLHIVPRKAAGVIDSRAGLIAPASIVDFGKGSVGMMSSILVDLDGDGLEARRMSKSRAKFDMDGDGIADDTGWVGDKDGMLVIDRNGDGKITAASELSFLTEKTDAKSAWDGLAELDTSRDGKINMIDARFGELMIWRDADGDGVTDDGELKSLADMGIKEISLLANPEDAQTKIGRNLPLSTATFTWDNGVTGTVGNVALAFDPSSKEPASSAGNDISLGVRSAQLEASQLMQAISSFTAGSTDDLSRSSREYLREQLDLLTAHAA